MEKTINPQGTHGTTVSRAANIQLNGFEISKGRLGKGAYFWSDSPYADYLAQSWWKFSYKDGRYTADKNKECAIIWATFQIKEDELLDLDDKELKKGLAELCLNKGIGYTAKTHELAAIITCFVVQIEKKLGLKFRILESTIATAPKEFVDKYPIGALGEPTCYVVLDTACIVINSVAICKAGN